jgi:hypothetical protein
MEVRAQMRPAFVVLLGMKAVFSLSVSIESKDEVQSCVSSDTSNHSAGLLIVVVIV